MILLLHGGAANVSVQFKSIKLNEMRNAVLKGYDVLVNGGNACDACETAVNVMENHPVFNAGYGSSLTFDGRVEMDAIVMDGSNLKSGAVAGVTRVSNPVSLARAVMDRSDHCLLISDGAECFANEIGIKLIDNSSLVHEWAFNRLNEFKTFVNTVNSDKPKEENETKTNDNEEHDTVGAVAIDSWGHVACATSTGGITGKQHGRVGDSPIIGAGGWADDDTGAVSTTGHGEAIMRVCLARQIMYQFKSNGGHLQEATDSALEIMKEKVDGYGGAIAVSRDGQIGIGFTTAMMPWIYVNSHDTSGDEEIQINYGVSHGEHFKVDSHYNFN